MGAITIPKGANNAIVVGSTNVKEGVKQTLVGGQYMSLGLVQKRSKRQRSSENKVIAFLPSR